MAIYACKECGKEMSTTASACPHCGAKPNRTSAFTWIVAGFFALMIFIWIVGSFNRDKMTEAEAAKAAALTPAQRAAAEKQAVKKRAQEQRERQEDAIAYACKDWVRKSLHDPDSAKFEDDFAYRHGTSFDRVQVQVRARNAFNAVRLSTFECRIRSQAGSLMLVGMQELPLNR